MNEKMERGKLDDARIDAALRSVGTARPEAGLEGRVLTRLAETRLGAARLAGAPAAGWRRYSAGVVGFAAVSLVCAVVVGGSVERERTRPGPTPAAPVLALPGPGMGAASAVHPAGPASAPLPAGTMDHGRAVHRLSHGRARIAEHAHKAKGVVPAEAGPE